MEGEFSTTLGRDDVVFDSMPQHVGVLHLDPACFHRYSSHQLCIDDVRVEVAGAVPGPSQRNQLLPTLVPQR